MRQRATERESRGSGVGGLRLVVGGRQWRLAVGGWLVIFGATRLLVSLRRDKKSSPPYEGGVPAASAGGVVLSTRSLLRTTMNGICL